MAKEFSPFLWVDTHGIPLEIVIKKCAEKGLTSDWVILIFALDALKAGWKKTKILSEIRELKNFSIPIPKSFDNG